MPWTISNSGPLARGGAVLIVCMLAACVEACVQRRADGRRGSDAAGDVISMADTVRKLDTGVVMTPLHPAGAAPATGNSTAPVAATGQTSPSPVPSTIPTPAAKPLTPAPPNTAIPPATLPAAPGTMATPADLAMLEQRHPIVPISGIPAAKLPDTFDEVRGGTRKHEALDILAPRGTPVHSADDGTVIKLFTSRAGGLTVYITGPAERFIYYYAHLDSYANGLAERQAVRKGDVLGYVGSSGDADPNVPHLHFAIARTNNIKEWWKGEPINPTTVLQAAAQDRVQ